MRGSVSIVGDPRRIDATFEDPKCCLPNPPKLTYYRRAVYQLALERLRLIVDAIKAHDTQHTGKVYRNERGEAVGRGKGIMPSLAREFPEVRGWTAGPATLRRTIEQAKTSAYFHLLQAAVHQVERESGEQLELFVMGAPRRELADLPPVVYPAHKGNARCRHCRRPHSSAVHRFHLKGSFTESHPGPARAAVRRKQRKEISERLADEAPF